LGIERVEPEAFDVVVEGEEVAAVALEADGLPDGNPTGRLVAGAGVSFGVGEGFGQERGVAVLGEPLIREGLRRCGEGLGGEVGAAGAVGDEEAGVIDDEYEALGAGERVPADPSIAVFEVEGGSTPEEQANPLTVLFGDLVKPVAGGEARAEEMFDFQERVEALAFGEVRERAHGQWAVGVRRGGDRASRFHPNLLCAGIGQMLSLESKVRGHSPL
jgi:hypothetical protein